MDEGFLKFKNRILTEQAIKSVLISLSSALLAVGLPLLIMKLCSVEIPFWSYIIIGLGVFGIALGICYLFRPNDKKIAKRIDKELMLNEKVQTMIEYKDKEGFLVEIQRDDTNNRLEKEPSKSLKFRMHFIYPIILVFALGISITSFVLPVRASEPDPGKEFEDDPFIIQSLKDLVKYVEKSNCTKDYKARTIKRLNDLIPLVESATTEAEVKEAVLETIDGIYDDLIICNSHALISGNALANAKDANTIHYSNALRDLKTENIDSLVVSLNEQLNIPLADLKKVMEECKVGLLDLPSASPLAQSYKDDELFMATIGLGNTCYSILNDINSDTFDKDKSKGMLLTAGNECKAAMEMQKCNNLTAKYIDLELKTLFPFIDEEVKPDTKPTTPPIPAPDESSTTEKGDNPGGAGNGEIIFGSDDLFYDPVLDKYVRYGDVINAYQGQIENDVKEGILTDEMIEFYREYYKNLMTKDESEK